jgi:hypothetical protein
VKLWGNRPERINSTHSERPQRLERRLDQAGRMAEAPVDPLTKERLTRLIRELEEQFRKTVAVKRMSLIRLRDHSLAFNILS